MLCTFSRNFPKKVEGFLEKERKLSRRFREETVTDLLVGGILGVCGRNVIVDFSDEVNTGADLELVYYDIATNLHFRLVIQAKRSFGRGKYWKRHSVRELFHRTKGTKRLQSDVLIKCASTSAGSTYPYYLIYNTKHTCELARKAGAHQLQGVNVVDGYFMNSRVKRAAKLSRPSKMKSLKELHLQFFPLSTLLCFGLRVRGIIGRAMALSVGSTDSIEQSIIVSSIPTPTDILNVVRKCRENTIESLAQTEIEKKEVESSIPMPKLSAQLPPHIRSLIDGEPVGEKDAGTSVIFISDSSLR
ncbi:MULTISPECIES: DUF6615 family protein [Thalassospira]|uniref:DUF6615 family protein n=1 Tax=Thalassospira TaxID=168934 RepID=UPI00028735CB|nr:MULTISPECIES: DUF6615 family protein [Thalassospira]EKF07351.1 hypothetical protein TH2_15712 [Thalassospira profundimaris WP0211]KJE35208.1 hypothetical protein UF64_11170 [Thalassospira sp. HJ]